MIVGNANYTRQGRDVPDVRPAYADAEGMRRYAIQTLGIRDGKVIFLRDATGAQMVRVFSSDRDHRGQLFDWMRPNRSRVFVYYTGHGAPGSAGGGPYLVPADADSARIELNGYPLATLYDNLAKIPAESVTVVIEACFSGLSQAGSVLGKASPVFRDVSAPLVPPKLTVITAGSAGQVASWEEDGSLSLFTEYFLKGMAGEADRAPYGNGDGTVARRARPLPQGNADLLRAALLRPRSDGTDRPRRGPVTDADRRSAAAVSGAVASGIWLWSGWLWRAPQAARLWGMRESLCWHWALRRLQLLLQATFFLSRKKAFFLTSLRFLAA